VRLSGLELIDDQFQYSGPQLEPTFRDESMDLPADLYNKQRSTT